MARRQGLIALAGAVAGVGVGMAAQRSMVKRRRRNDPEAGEHFGRRRGPRCRYLELPDGARLFIEETGEQSSSGVVFVHGSALRTDVWHYQLAGIDGRRLVFYDLRGHGLSKPKGDDEFSIETLARDLEAVIEDSGLEEVVVVGHSIGGMVAMQLASSRPALLGSKIKALVLVTTTYRPAAETVAGGAAVARLERVLRRPLDVLGPHSERLDRLRKIIKPSDALFLTVAFGGFGAQASAKQINFTYDMLAETTSDVILDLIRSYRKFDVTEVLGDITVPALVVGGTHDRITVPSASEYVAAHLPKADLHLLEGCGHMPMLERHRQFNELLASFFADVLGSSERSK